MQKNIKERIEYIKQGQTPPDNSQRKRKFSHIFLLVNIVIFIILATLILQKKEPADFMYETVSINDIQVRYTVIHTINEPILISITLNSETASQLVSKNPFITITINHDETTITSMTAAAQSAMLTVSPQKPVTITKEIPIEPIIEYAKIHDLLKPKRYEYHSVIPLTVRFTLHTVMDYSTSLKFNCKVSAL